MAVMGFDFAGISGGLVGFYNDDWANGVYLHHQVHSALMAGRFDLFDPNQFFPFGYNPAHTNGGNILEMLVSGLFRMFAPWPMWLSLGALAWIPLNMLAFVPLGRRLWGDKSVVLAAAATWALFPPVLHQLAAGRLTQVALVGVPLAFAGLLDMAETPQGQKRRGIGLLAIGLALAGLGYWFNAIFIALLSPAFLIYGRRRWRKMAVEMIAAGGLALVMVSPVLAVVFWPVLNGAPMPGTHIDPTSLPLMFPDALKLSGGQVPGLADWLPWVAIPGGVLSLFLGRRRWLWFGLAAVVVVFSMGPGQLVGTEVYPAPYWIIWKVIPGLSRMMHPDRWMLIGGIFIAILAIDGLVAWRPVLAWLVPIGVLIQLFYRGVLPLGSFIPEVPAHWEALSQQRERGAVVVLPLHGAQLAGQYQRVHGRALWGGMIEDQPWAQPKAWVSYERASPVLSGFRAISYGRETPLEWSPGDVQRLCDDGFSWVVLDQGAWSGLPSRAAIDVRSLVSLRLGEPVFRGPSGVLWSLDCGL
jgi:hypothetical protein